jgi:hypothetical protein
MPTTEEACWHPNCQKEIEFHTPLPWCEFHWTEWWDCDCADEVDGENSCEFHKYMSSLEEAQEKWYNENHQ